MAGVLMKTSIMAAVLGFSILSGFSSSAKAESTPARFGTVSPGGPYGQSLLLNGKPFNPPISAESGKFDFVKTVNLGNADAMIFRDDGGTGCPAQFLVVTLSPQGWTSTHEFGTCTDIVAISQSGNALLFAMTGFKAHTSNAEIQRAYREHHVFRVVGPAVTDNGKPVQ
jgi:hypothetical protein